MRTTLLLSIILFAITTTSNAQDLKTECTFEYQIIAKKSAKELKYEDRFVDFNWNISKLSPSDEISIEVVKIFDCFIGIDGKQTETYLLIDLKSKELDSKESLKIMHVDMLAKCFKWRVILKSDLCTKQTDWNYYSFFD